MEKRAAKRLGKGDIFVMFILCIAVMGVVAAAGTNTVNLRDWIKVQIISPVESNGAIPVNIQDQTTRTGDTYFSQAIGAITTLQADATIDEYSINVTTGHGILVEEMLALFDSQGQRVYFGEVLTSGTNIITLDTPLNYNYNSSSTSISRRTIELNVDGSTTRQTFRITNPTNSSLDITRILFSMYTTGQPKLDEFGDLSSLNRGIIFRVVNGINVNYFNVKENGDFVGLMHDVTFYDTTKQGTNGLGGRLTYGGQDKHGVVIRLDQGGTLEIIVQDDLTNLLKFRMVATFHEVTD